ncbi:endolytic transglycosylase MltG [Nonomuraea sp. B12E4]|uniref:endolytic transglycosylase MltG n=1 Tax=Nonomuraea sp. B12E4 TaxID=3153564 RepID=UPI00325DB042
MNIEDVLRDTLADMAYEEPPPPPARFLRGTGRRPWPHRAALAAAAGVAVLVVGSTVTLQGMAGRQAVPGGPGEAVASTEPHRAGDRVTMKEGLWLSDTVQLLAKHTGRPVAEFARAARNGAALGLPAYAKGGPEGFLFPGTYDLSPSSSAEEILAAMVTRFKRTADDIHLEDAARRLGRTPQEIVIIASIIQAESMDKQTMPKVARVIYNRLKRKPPMRLQMDSTVLYGLGKHGIEAKLQDLKSRSKYNTYAFPGLPPGPIGNPGRDALMAALHPATGPWLQYVLVDPKTGETEFIGSSPAEMRKLHDLMESLRGS